MRILGIDPGSRLTGYGCIDSAGLRLTHVAHGTLVLSSTSGKQETALEHRLLSIYEGLSEVIQEFKPQVLAIERVFFAKNAVSALKLGQARGAAILTGMIHGLSIAEYSPSEVKQAVVGQGHADKNQVAAMVKVLIGQQVFKTSDASDALALAICHAQHARFAGGRSSLQSVAAQLKKGGKKKRISLAQAVGLAGKGE